MPRCKAPLSTYSPQELVGVQKQWSPYKTVLSRSLSGNSGCFREVQNRLQDSIHINTTFTWLAFEIPSFPSPSSQTSFILMKWRSLSETSCLIFVAEAHHRGRVLEKWGTRGWGTKRGREKRKKIKYLPFKIKVWFSLEPCFFISFSPWKHKTSSYFNGWSNSCRCLQEE